MRPTKSETTSAKPMASGAISRHRTSRKACARSSRSMAPRATSAVWLTKLAAAVIAMALLIPSVSGTAADAVRTQVRRVQLVENAGLPLTSSTGKTLDERGRATGTFNAPATARFEPIPQPHHSGIHDLSQRRFDQRQGTSATTSSRTTSATTAGHSQSGRGTGTYTHASGSNIGISGTINRFNLAVTVKVNSPASV